MSSRNLPDGKPDLEHKDDLLRYWYNSSLFARQQLFGLTPLEQRLSPFRRRADRGAPTLREFYEMVDILLEKHQMTHVVSAKSPWLLNFPHMLVKPIVGDKIVNKTTKETYQIKYIPSTDWTGAVLLEVGLISPKASDHLEFLNPVGVGAGTRKLIQFSHFQPNRPATPLDTNKGDIGVEASEPHVPTVTVQLIKQKPGHLEGSPFGDSMDLKPRLRGPSVQHPHDRNFSVQTYGQWFDNLIRFTCYETTHSDADNLVEWLTDFFNKYTWVFQKNGIQQLLYWGRDSDVKIETWRDDILGYAIDYYVRIEKVSVRVVPNITTIRQTISVNSTTKTRATNETDPENTGDLVMGPYREQFVTLFDAVHDDSGNYLYGDLLINET